ncbi:hypothetical protein LHP98_07835 [Rhodobacter sp. Har01]|uniref:hypothetical protein n=1 Tax=Rhodobacter sp. Har01 TaxID=2883999 RepID=UPI001D080DA6|nr:hypothetical protein [Rhodobacter sp. Har01]MCB6178038.1 hypothetical protein [Rhodobacter sp. Har01]
MKKVLSAVAILALTGSAALAGGPVVVVEEGQPEVVQEKSSSSVGLLPILLGVVIICAIACGDNDEQISMNPP